MSDPLGQETHQDGQEKVAQYQHIQDQAQSKKQSDATYSQSVESQATQADVTPEGESTLSNQNPFESQVNQLQLELNATQQELTNQKESFLRLAAELENSRRRHAEEINKAHKYAIEGFAEALLPVKDSLEAALALKEQTLETLLEGVLATLRQLEHAFERGKVQAIYPKGEKFDPNRHQAVSAVPGNSQQPPVASNQVVDVMQKGYLLNERVLRPALVIVSQ